MAGIGSVHDLAAQFAAVVIERHVEKSRADPRTLPRRTPRASAPEHRSDISEAGCTERRPTEQPRAEKADRDGDCKSSLEAGKGGDRERHYSAADLDAARKHDRIGRAKHLQHRIQENNGD